MTYGNVFSNFDTATMYDIGLYVPAPGTGQSYDHYFLKHWRAGPNLSKAETLVYMECQ